MAPTNRTYRALRPSKRRSRMLRRPRWILGRLRRALLVSKAPTRPFFRTLHARLTESGEVRLGDLLASTHEQGFGLMILVAGLTSFIPGVSMAGGLLGLLLGLQMVQGRPRPWLPQRLANLRLHRGRIKEALARFESWLLRLGNPTETRHPLRQTWMGLLIAWTSFLTALPVPPILPFGNALPAASLCLFGAALLEERPSWVWAGILGMIATTLYLGLSARLIAGALLHWLG